ncbi:MAG TPA: hypothetical protein VHJ17_22555 [Thermomonospora sp.]|nr:hypothetical protein [Thermomonospora sp.]
MAKEKITITVDPEVVAQARAEVAAGRAASVSAYIAEATVQRAVRERRARDLLDDWGPFSDQELDFARALLDGEQRTERAAS